MSEEGEEEEEEEAEAEDGGEEKETVWDIVFEEISRGLAFWSEVDLLNSPDPWGEPPLWQSLPFGPFKRKKIEEDV
jgi:hypothetical protein